MGSRLNLLFGAGLGAAAMYYLDPSRGRYRRALVRNQLVHAGYKTAHGAAVVGRDMRNRTSGMLANARSLIDFSKPEDAVLVERVRSCLGRVVTHPSSVEVAATDGIVTLAGPILADEVRLLLDCVHHVRGVEEIRNSLDVHEQAGNIPGLQGTPPDRPRRLGRQSWSPAARVAGGAGGVLAALFGFGKRGVGGALLGTAGLLLAGRAATNIDMRRLWGIGAGRHAVDVQKSIRIHAPVDEVYRLWSSFESFPSLMTHVRRVRRIENGGKERWRWTVRTRAGMQFEYDATVTARDDNRLLAWRTEDGGLLRHAGRVLFHDNDDGSTTVDVRMVYNPIAGAIGHGIAWLIGADPKRQMDDDLLRMKTYLETGRRPRDAAEHTDVPDEIRHRDEPITPSGRPEHEAPGAASRTAH